MLEAKHRDQENLYCVSFSAEFASVGWVDHVLFKSDELLIFLPLSWNQGKPQVNVTHFPAEGLIKEWI